MGICPRRQNLKIFHKRHSHTNFSYVFWFFRNKLIFSPVIKYVINLMLKDLSILLSIFLIVIKLIYLYLYGYIDLIRMIRYNINTH